MKKGISLIALIITIIVIIILAAVVIGSSMRTPETAGYARFCEDISTIQEAVSVKYAEAYGKKVITGLNPTKEQIYGEMIMIGGLSTNVKGKNVKELDSSKINLELPVYGKGDNSQTWCVDTSTGKVYLVPGYSYNDKIYVAQNETLIAGDDNPGALEELGAEGDYAKRFVINSWDDLLEFSRSVNAGETQYNDENIEILLGRDITNPNSTVSFNPIGTYDYSFNGSFNGQNYTIDGVYINFNDYLLGDIGLFGNSMKAIYDLNLTNVNIEAQNAEESEEYFTVGGLCGYTRGTIRNCTVSGVINTDGCPKVGGIAGMCEVLSGFTVIQDCTVSGTINAENGKSAGGIVGWTERTYIYDCTNYATVSVATNGIGYAGGIAGLCYIGGMWGIERCTNSGEISVSSSTYYGCCAGGITGMVVRNTWYAFNNNSDKKLSEMVEIVDSETVRIIPLYSSIEIIYYDDSIKDCTNTNDASISATTTGGNAVCSGGIIGAISSDDDIVTEDTIRLAPNTNNCTNITATASNVSNQKVGNYLGAFAPVLAK